MENKKRQGYDNKVAVANVNVDKEYLIRLDELVIGLDFIPKNGEVIQLCYRCNALFGGTTIGLPLKTICKENKKLALGAAKALNLNLVGFDFMCEDISVPITQTGLSSKQSTGLFVEANSYPDLTNHEYPFTGQSNPVAALTLKAIIKKHPLSYLWTRIKHLFKTS